MNKFHPWRIIFAIVFLSGCASTEIRRRTPTPSRPSTEVQNRSIPRPSNSTLGGATTLPRSSTPTPSPSQAPATSGQLLSELESLAQQSRWSDLMTRMDDFTEGDPSKQNDLNPSETDRFQNLRVRGLMGLGSFADALMSADRGAYAANEQPARDWFRITGQTLIESRLTEVELAASFESLRDNEIRAAAAFRLGELSLEAKDLSAARRQFGYSVSLSPNSTWANRAQELIASIESNRRVEPRTIGALLPLTGRHASAGQKSLRGIQLGLGLTGSSSRSSSSSYRLAVSDSEASGDIARRGVDRLIREDNVIAIIGGIPSRTAIDVATATSDLGVPHVALSQRSGLTEIGPTVFRNSLTAEMQVRFLVDHSMRVMGLKRFAILSPNDAYGTEFTNLFWNEVLARGGEVTSVQIYAPSETDFRQNIQRLVGQFYTEDRFEEYRLKIQQWRSEPKNRGSRVKPPDDLLKAIVNFDAIFIPDSVKSLGQAAAMLRFQGVRGVHLIGTNLWNTPSLVRRVEGTGFPVFFADSFLTSDPSFARSDFVQQYRSVFGEDPGILETQGYDAAILLRSLIEKGSSSRESLARALAGARDVPGGLGRMSVSSDREVQRDLIPLTVKGGAILPISE